MISGKFRLRNFANWRMVYFIVTDIEDAEEILDELCYLKCSRKFMRKAERLLYSGRRNIGLAYTKAWRRSSIIVVSKTTNIWEFFNSMAHEIDHIEKHIAKALGFSPYSESASYLVGEIVRSIIHNIFRKMIC